MNHLFLESVRPVRHAQKIHLIMSCVYLIVIWPNTEFVYTYAHFVINSFTLFCCSSFPLVPHGLAVTDSKNNRLS